MTVPFQTPDQYLAHLRSAEVIPRPMGEPWKVMIDRITVPGRIAEVNEETYDWFFECLPPHYLGDGFAFAEGQEPLRYFWQRAGRYYCRQLTWDETLLFCRLARIPPPL